MAAASAIRLGRDGCEYPIPPHSTRCTTKRRNKIIIPPVAQRKNHNYDIVACREGLDVIRYRNAPIFQQNIHGRHSKIDLSAGLAGVLRLKSAGHWQRNQTELFIRFTNTFETSESDCHRNVTNAGQCLDKNMHFLQLLSCFLAGGFWPQMAETPFLWLRWPHGVVSMLEPSAIHSYEPPAYRNNPPSPSEGLPPSLPFHCAVLESADSSGGPSPALLHSLREKGCKLILAQVEDLEDLVQETALRETEERTDSSPLRRLSTSAPIAYRPTSLNREWYDAVFDKVLSITGEEGRGNSPLERFFADEGLPARQAVCFACTDAGSKAAEKWANFQWNNYIVWNIHACPVHKIALNHKRSTIFRFPV